jgi:hypothetical protein
VESVENQTAVSHPFHRPLEISQKRRDFHIPTAPACAGWKSGKPKAGFPLFHAAQAMMMTVLVSKNQNRRKGRCAASASSLAPTQSFTSQSTFMLILRLENAHKRPGQRGGRRPASIATGQVAFLAPSPTAD